MGGAAAWILPITLLIVEAWPLSSTLASTSHPRNLAFSMASVQSRVGVQMVTPFAGPRRAARTAVVAQIPRSPDYLRIARGELTVVRNWIPPLLLTALREDAMALYDAGSFSKSGLSNRAAGDANAFGKQDRLCLTVRTRYRPRAVPAHSNPTSHAPCSDALHAWGSMLVWRIVPQPN